jgi:creatinine amidohydrolase
MLNPQQPVLSPEVRLQFLLPHQVEARFKQCPLIILPVGPLEWHCTHLACGMDAINAERTSWALAQEVGGVVHPTLYMGTERERDAKTLKSLGFSEKDYVVGMDFPSVPRLHRSYYFSEEMFALTVRAHIEQFIDRGYRFIYIVNGHGAVNHNATLQRLCVEFSNKPAEVKAAYGIAFPEKLAIAGEIAHAGSHEASLLMHQQPQSCDVKQLPALPAKLRYADTGIVDSGGFTGRPGEGFHLPESNDPRTRSSAAEGKALYEQAVADLAASVTQIFNLRK